MEIQPRFSREFLYVLSGILAHALYFIHGEHHLHPLAPVKAYGCLILTITAYGAFLGDGKIVSSFSTAIYTLSLHQLGLFSSIVIYRLFFHRLCRFPGPVAARISMGWLLWQNIRCQKGYLKLASLQEKYGKFVRVGKYQNWRHRTLGSFSILGPNKLVVFDANTLQAIENPANGCTKSDWYDCGYPTTGLNMWREIDLHDSRRKVWANAFGSQSMAYFDTIINLYCTKFVRLLAKSEGCPINLTQYFNLLTFDIIGEIGFSHTFGALERGAGYKIEEVVARFMEALGAISAMPWLCRLLTDIPGMLSPWTGFLEWCRNLVLQRIEVAKHHPVYFEH